MRILYLSENMAAYAGAMYQRDVMEELAAQADVVFHGPGFAGFDPREPVERVLRRVGGADLVLVGHAWLADSPGTAVDPFPGLRLEDCPLPKAMILNKEYANLDDKLAWIGRQGFALGFSHHHDTDAFAARTGTPFLFWPFAFNDRLFGQGPAPAKDVDFAFCGLLQNLSRHSGQADTRVRVMRRLFHCLGDIPLAPRRAYSRYALRWNAIPRSRWQVRLAMLLGRYRRLPDEEYRDLQRRSRVYLNTLSPAGLVSPRIAENMASRALVLCESSPNYGRIFPEDCFVTFRPDLSDFDEVLGRHLADEGARRKVVDRAFEVAMTAHSWRRRVADMLAALEGVAR